MGFFYLIGCKSVITIGRDRNCDLSIIDPSISRVQFSLKVNATSNFAKVYVHSRNGILIDGKPVDRGNVRQITKSDIISFCKVNILWLGDYIYVVVPDSVIVGARENMNIIKSRVQEHFGLISEGDINTTFTPSIRNMPSISCDAIEIEAPPKRRLMEKPSVMLAVGPALTMAIPIMLGFNRKISVLSSIFAAIWAASNVLNRYSKIKNEERRRKNSYLAYIDECEDKIVKRREEIIYVLNKCNPTLDEYMTGGGNPFLLWNREDNDKEKGHIRVGIGTISMPFDICVPKEKFEQLDDSLKELPIKLKDKYKNIENVPVTINFEELWALGIIYESEEQMIKVLNGLLLHLAVTYSPSEAEIDNRLSDDKLKRSFGWMTFLPHTKNLRKSRLSIIFTDNTSSIKLQTQGDNTWVILIKRRLVELPSYIDKVLTIKKDIGVITSTNVGVKGHINVKFDALDYATSSEYARMLERLNNNSVLSVDIPATVQFGEMFTSLDAEGVIKRWGKCDTTKSIAFPVGKTVNGRLLMLDLHYKKWGAHGLIGGTTGSGKSELLSTMILSMAASYPPDMVGFVLIDYKGGGMSNMFRNLPHVMGNISNLSKKESERALISLRSENIRRQQIFSDVGVNNIDDYVRGYVTNKYQEPLPHVFVIIDEFAELKKEQPEYMSELISIAAVGRSLGIHLILATQKPAGVVDDKIRSNSRFRISLRVEDKTDSMDMLKRPDAAFIRECGRAILQVGNDDVYECFQSGYAMGCMLNAQNEKVTIYDETMKKIDICDEEELRETVSDITWYQYTLNEICRASEAMKSRKCSKLWKEPLSSDIKYVSSDYSNSSYAVGDDPINQRYIEYTGGPEEVGHIGVIGNSGTGKSTFIETFLTFLLNTSVCKEQKYEIYIIDYGGGKLKQFEDYNLCGGYIGRDEYKRTPMMLLYLRDIIMERRRTYYNNENMKENRILLVIDNYGEAISSISEMAEPILLDILKYGRGVGVYMLITAFGVGNCEVPSRIFDRCETKIVLGTIEKYQVANILKIPIKNVVDIEDIPGRGISLNVYGIYEQQIKIVENHKSISCVIKASNSRVSDKITGYTYVPENVTADEFLNRITRDITREEVDKNNILPVGYIRENGRRYELPFGQAKCILVCGGKGTGKKSFLTWVSIVAAMYDYRTYQVSCIESLCADVDEVDNRSIKVIPDLGQMLESFYDNSYDKSLEDKVCKFFDNSIKESNGNRIIAIVSEQIRTQFQTKKIYESIQNKPYVINFGGGLDNVRMFDFSYLPYSILSRKQSAGEGTVMKYAPRLFYGDIIIPKLIYMED